MGLFNALIGNSSEISNEDKVWLDKVLVANETIISGFKLYRDMVVFTTKRLMLVDKQGLSGKKVSFTSVPYKNIIRFSVETVGSFDMDSDVKVWMHGATEPHSIKVSSNANILEFQRLLAQSILG